MSGETFRREKQLWEVKSEILPLLLNNSHLDLLLKIKSALKTVAVQKDGEVLEPFVKPMSKEAFEEDILESINDVKNGKVLSLEAFEKEMESWG